MKTVEMRGLDYRIAQAGKISVSHIVGQKENNVRPIQFSRSDGECAIRGSSGELSSEQLKNFAA
jgi:hypothetical protein